MGHKSSFSSSLRRQLWWLKNRIQDASAWQHSQREFNTILKKSPDDPWQVLHTYQGTGFYRGLVANQDDYEIRTLYERVIALQPQNIVEIGTRDGASLFLWSQIPTLKRLISIDLPGGIHGGGYVPQRGRLYQQFIAQPSDVNLHLLRCDSQQTETYDQVTRLLENQPLDFLFIDGDHRYSGVKRDYELYRGLVRSGGLIAFHDIYPNTRDATIQVNQLWDEIKATGATIEEIVHQPYRGWYGIGVITVS